MESKMESKLAVVDREALARKILVAAFVAWLPAAAFAVYWFETPWALAGCFAGFFPMRLLTAATPSFEIAALLASVVFLALAVLAWRRPRLLLSVAFSILIVLSTCLFLVRMHAYRVSLLAVLDILHLNALDMIG